MKSMQDKQKIVSISENLYEKLKAKVKELENIVEGQHSHIAMIQGDLYNERVRNENLERLVTNRPNSKTTKD